MVQLPYHIREVQCSSYWTVLFCWMTANDYKLHSKLFYSSTFPMNEWVWYKGMYTCNVCMKHVCAFSIFFFTTLYKVQTRWLSYLFRYIIYLLCNITLLIQYSVPQNTSLENMTLQGNTRNFWLKPIPSICIKIQILGNNRSIQILEF